VSGESILIVEDDFIVAKVIEKSLTDLGYRIAGLVATGQEAIDTAGEKKPDLVLMDIRLQGDMDGIQASEKIHSALDIPVVFLTAFSDKKTFSRALVTAPYGYIIKPFSSNTLSATISVALNKKREEKKLEEHRFWLEGTLRSLSEGVITVNMDEKVVLVNPAAEQMTGWANREAYGQPINSVLVFADSISQKSFHYHITPVLKEGIIATIPSDSFVLSKNKTRYLLDDSFASPVKNRQGAITGAAIVLYPRPGAMVDAGAATGLVRPDEKPREISIAFKDRAGRITEPADPVDAEGWNDRGNYYIFLRRYDDAIRAYDRAISIHMMSYQSWYGKGTALAKLGRTDDALKAFDQALSIHPRNHQVLTAKGVLLKKIGKDGEAERCFELARLYSA
jgi:CheY-like chemotaxis protein